MIFPELRIMQTFLNRKLIFYIQDWKNCLMLLYRHWGCQCRFTAEAQQKDRESVFLGFQGIHLQSSGCLKARRPGVVEVAESAFGPTTSEGLTHPYWWVREHPAWSRSTLTSTFTSINSSVSPKNSAPINGIEVFRRFTKRRFSTLMPQNVSLR